MARGVRRALGECLVLERPLADGGEGSLDVLAAVGFRAVAIRVHGPSGHGVLARLGIRNQEVFLESREAIGYDALEGDPLAPLATTSRGVGELILAALEHGAHRLVIGLGGSVTSDGGLGLLVALGARIVDQWGAPIGEGGGALAAVEHIALDGLNPRLAEVEVVAACDVDAPLLGPAGAARLFAPQKGASPAEVQLLEAGMARWADRLEAASGRRARERAGAGAAGGVGFALACALGARLVRGAALLADLVGFDEALAGADLVLTGEGSLDRQSLQGKVPCEVAARASSRGIPCFAVAGRVELGAEELGRCGLTGATSLLERVGEPSRALADAAGLLEDASCELVAQWRSGLP
jgi:glycerate kinase